MNIAELWRNGGKEDFERALKKYGGAVKSVNAAVEERLNGMRAGDFEKMSGRDFYRFLVGDYADWKYTDARRKATVRWCLEAHHQKYTDEEFGWVLKGIFQIDKNDIFLHFANITRIGGIGTAGASGILTLIFPGHFGTVDRFVVENLQKIYDKESYYGRKLHAMDPESLFEYDAVVITRILREKAEKLNERSEVKDFTPRKLDMVLRAVR